MLKKHQLLYLELILAAARAAATSKVVGSLCPVTAYGKPGDDLVFEVQGYVGMVQK